MTFNHYARMKHILAHYSKNDWVIKRINKPTTAQNFKGETVHFTHYYRIYDGDDMPIKYCKFQQIERLAATLEVPFEALPIIE